MKKRVPLLKIFSCLLTVSLLLGGCGKTTPIVCPYTDLAWDTTEEELFEAKGEEYYSYNSTYGGLTYEYDGSYMEKDGRIKYMYNEDGLLASVAFTYGSPDADELAELYEEMHAELNEEYGKSEYSTSADTNYGDIWEMKEGKVILSVMITSSNKALQIAYVNPKQMKLDESK